MRQSDPQKMHLARAEWVWQNRPGNPSPSFLSSLLPWSHPLFPWIICGQHIPGHTHLQFQVNYRRAWDMELGTHWLWSKLFVTATHRKPVSTSEKQVNTESRCPALVLSRGRQRSLLNQSTHFCFKALMGQKILWAYLQMKSVHYANATIISQQNRQYCVIFK